MNDEKAIIISPDKSLDHIIKHGTIDEVMALTERLLKGKQFLNVNTPEDAMMILLKTKGLGIDFANGIDHIYKIGDKTGVDFHIISAIINRPSSMIFYEVIDYAKPIYNYIGKVKDDTIVLWNDTQGSLPEEYVRILPTTPKDVSDKIKSEGKTPVIAQPEIVFTYTVGTNKYNIFNKKSTISFERQMKMLDGELRTKRFTSTYSLRDAADAEVFLNKKREPNVDSAWIRHQDNQLFVRCFSRGARIMANDLILGCYEVSELLDTAKIAYDRVEESTVTILEPEELNKA